MTYLVSESSVSNELFITLTEARDKIRQILPSENSSTLKSDEKI